MEFPPPPGFEDLTTAYATTSEQQHNVIGIVVDNLSIAKSRGSDWMCKTTLSDPGWLGGFGAPFTFFNKNQQSLPVIKNNGDVLIIRNFKVKPFQGSLGLTNISTTWVLLEGSSVSNSVDEDGKDVKFEKMGVRVPSPTVTELQYAKKIVQSLSPTAIQQPAKPTSLQVASIMTAAGGTVPKAKDKFSLIKDLKPGDRSRKVFVDLVCEVRRTYKADSRMEISVTDYTIHGLLFDHIHESHTQGADGDQFGYIPDTKKDWPGPFGKMTMTVALWDAHARWAHSNLQEGSYVLLKNVKISMDSNGDQMQGNVHGDQANLDKVNISVLKPRDADGNEPLRNLLRRKQAYERKAKEEGFKMLRDPSASKRNLASEAETPVEDSEEAARKARNKKKREMKKRKRNGPNAPVEIAEDRDAAGETPGRPAKVSKNTKTFLPTNTEVVCAKFHVPIKPIHQILDPNILKRKDPQGNEWYLPFQNCKYHCHIRVVDFFPHDVADFAVPCRDSDYDGLSENEYDMEDSDVDATDPEARWEWRFILVVEDVGPPPPRGQKKDRMELLVTQGDGEYLLKMDACDLRGKRNAGRLVDVRDKLFTLWGDLEEKKQEARAKESWRDGDEIDYQPRSNPFETLVKEYGVRSRDAEGRLLGETDYMRMFRMFQTTIK